MTEPATPTVRASGGVAVRRRVGAWFVDAALVGIPAVIVSIVVPVLPVGVLIWVGYRIYVAVSGRSLGRVLCRWSMRTVNGAPPGRAGVVWFVFVSSVPFAGLCAAGVSAWIVNPNGWSWVLWAPLLGVFGGVVSLASAMFWWSGLAGNAPRADRWAKVVAVRTTPSTAGPGVR